MVMVRAAMLKVGIAFAVRARWKLMESLFPQIRPKAIKTITIINKYKLNFPKRQINGHYSHQHLSNTQ